MKVMLINNTFGDFGGGDGKITYDTGKLLREKGFEVFFFSSTKKPYYEENYEYSPFFPKEFKKFQIINPIRIFYNFEAEKKLSRLIQIIKPDIVHINNIQYNLTPSVLVSCKKNKIPVVMTFHDSHCVCPTATLIKGKSGYCKNRDCRSGNILSCIINKCFSSSFLKSCIAGFEFLFRKKMNFYDIPDAFICPSNYVYDIALKSGIKKDKLFVVTNFVNSEYLDIQPSYTNQNYFLYVGRLVKEKGLDYLLKAFKDLPEIKLKIVGDGNYKNNLEKLAKDLNLLNVEFLGFKNGIELENEYKNAKAIFLPSICSENSPLTILESFAWGKSVIASDIGGIPEIVINNYNGFTVPPSNSTEITKAVRKLHGNKELALKLGVNARKTLEKKYNSEIYFEKLENIYYCVLNKYSNCENKTDFPEKTNVEYKSLVNK